MSNSEIIIVDIIFLSCISLFILLFNKSLKREGFGLSINFFNVSFHCMSFYHSNEV